MRHFTSFNIRIMLLLGSQGLLSKRMVEAISHNPKLAYWYAGHILHGPWPEGEAAICTSSGFAAKYAFYVLKLKYEEAMKWAVEHNVPLQERGLRE